MVRETGPRLQQAQRQQRDAKETISRMESQNADAGETDKQATELRAAKQQLELATKAVDEARQTNEFANRMESEVSLRARKLRNEKQPELNLDRPVVQSVQHTLDVTQSEIRAIQSELSNWQNLANHPPQLQATAEEASRLIDRQRDVNADVADAGEDIRRAGRHEQRLEKPEIAESVEQIADAVTKQALPATEEAERSLLRASENASESPAANNDLQTAGQQIDRTAELLQALLGASAEQQAASGSPSSSAEQADNGDQGV